MKKLIVLLVLTVTLAAFAARQIGLYEETGTVNVTKSGVYWDPVSSASQTEWILTLNHDSNSPYTSYGYYLMKNGRSKEFTLSIGDNAIKTNQYLGFWASDSKNTIYSTGNGSSNLEMIDSMTLGINSYTYSWFGLVSNNISTDTIVFAPVIHDEGETTFGQPLPAAIPTLLILGSVSGLWRRRKNAKK